MKQSKKMLMLLAGTLFIVLLTVGGWVVFARPNSQTTCSVPSETVTLEMQQDSYSRQNITIKKCTKVVFENKSSEPRWPASDLHPTHGIYPEFDPQEKIPVGKSWSFVFEKVGRWRYHDHLHPSTRGLITVKPN